MSQRADDIPEVDTAFDQLLREATEERIEAPPARSRRSGSWLLLASACAALIGIGSIAAALLMATAGSTNPPAPILAQPTPNPAPLPAEAPEQERSATPDAAVDEEWLGRTAERTGIPQRALSAYAAAAARISIEQPICGLGWNTLAGIGFVESEHGSYGGSKLSPNGDATPPIIGIPLDGTSTDRIPDTDGGALDGDKVWDRAVGPMQFIPSTWKVWGSDGNGDDLADPQNVDDAAYSAARYLCSGGRDLRDPEQWIAAVAAYNDTIEYNHDVASAADHYAQLAHADEPGE